MGDKQSLKNRNYNYLKAWFTIDPNKWINGGELERKAQEIGYKASNCSRRCRELYQNGKIDRQIINGSVSYKFRPQITF